MLKILVERKGLYNDNLREDLSFKDCYDVSATFKLTEKDGEELGDIDDLVEMFISAAKLEGYSDHSIMQSLYDHAILCAYENGDKIDNDREDSKVFIY